MSFIEVVPDVLTEIYDECDYSTQISFGHVCKVFRDVVIRRSADTCQCAECLSNTISWPFEGPDPFARERRSGDGTIISCSFVCYHTAECNYFDLLKWLAGAGYSMKNGERICDYAITNGNYEMLVWAVENGCVWTQNNVDRIVGKNRSDMFEYLAKNDGSRIGINFTIIFVAVHEGITAILQFAYHEVGYMFDSYNWDYPLDLTKCGKECLDLLLKMRYSTARVMHHIMLKNRIDVLVWLHSNYPDNVKRCITQDRETAWYCRESIDVLSWILDQNWPRVAGDIMKFATDKGLTNVVAVVESKIKDKFSLVENLYPSVMHTASGL